MRSLTIRGVTKSYGKVPALNGIELSLQEGEFLVLVGPARAGKTTLVRAVAGLEAVDGGAIQIDGETVNGWAPRDRKVALVFQRDALFPSMSVYRNIAFGLNRRRAPRAEIEARVKRFADFVGIGGLLDTRADRLEPGRSQLVAIGRALVRDDALCLFDDPLAPLDLPLREAIRNEIKRLHAEFPATKMFATRDPLEAMTLGDRIAVMRAGRIEQEGTPLELFEKPVTRFVAGFFGSPPMNFLPGKLVRGEAGDSVRLSGNLNVRLPPGRLPKDVSDGLSVVLGFRPEHMMRAIRASPADGSLRHDAEIELLQPVGSRAYATFRLGGVAVVAELQAHDVSRPGDRIPIDVNLKRAAIFDAETEKSL
jgi:multiple sugar transport system ATP-binding protein